jgi:hypothetical protein
VEVLESGCRKRNHSVQIAEAAFLYVGEEEVSKYRPYEAMLKDGVWTVFGDAQAESASGKFAASSGDHISCWLRRRAGEAAQNPLFR